MAAENESPDLARGGDDDDVDLMRQLEWMRQLESGQQHDEADMGEQAAAEEEDFYDAAAAAAASRPGRRALSAFEQQFDFDGDGVLDADERQQMARVMLGNAKMRVRNDMTPAGRRRACKETFEDLEFEMKLHQEAHEDACAYYRRRYYYLLIPMITISIVISTIAGVWDKIAQASGDGDGETTTASASYQQVVISVLSGLNALLAALLAFSKYQSKMDAHAACTRQFSELYQSFHYQLFGFQFAEMETESMMEKLTETRKNLHACSRTCPFSLPRRIDEELSEGRRQWRLAKLTRQQNQQEDVSPVEQPRRRDKSKIGRRWKKKSSNVMPMPSFAAGPRSGN